MAQRVREVMTGNPVTLPKDATVVEAARVMREQGIGDVIVTDGDRAEGIVTDRDIVVRAIAEGGNPESVRLEQVESGQLTAVAPGGPVEAALKNIREEGGRRGVPCAGGG